MIGFADQRAAERMVQLCHDYRDKILEGSMSEDRRSEYSSAIFEAAMESVFSSRVWDELNPLMLPQQENEAKIFLRAGETLKAAYTMDSNGAMVKKDLDEPYAVPRDGNYLVTMRLCNDQWDVKVQPFQC